MRSVLTTLLVCAVTLGAAYAQKKPSIGKLIMVMSPSDIAAQAAATTI